MKNLTIIFSSLCLVILYGCSERKYVKNNNVSNNAGVVKVLDSLSVNSDGPFLYVENNKYEFGDIKKKKVPYINIEFPFMNIGNSPLVIVKAAVSCGCLSAEYPKQPIKPGEKGVVKVQVDTKSQEGVFNKTIILKTNAEEDLTLLRIKGHIK